MALENGARLSDDDAWSRLMGKYQRLVPTKCQHVKLSSMFWFWWPLKIKTCLFCQHCQISWLLLKIQTCLFCQRCYQILWLLLKIQLVYIANVVVKHLKQTLKIESYLLCQLYCSIVICAVVWSVTFNLLASNSHSLQRCIVLLGGAGIREKEAREESKDWTNGKHWRGVVGGDKRIQGWCAVKILSLAPAQHAVYPFFLHPPTRTRWRAVVGAKCGHYVICYYHYFHLVRHFSLLHNECMDMDNGRQWQVTELLPGPVSLFPTLIYDTFVLERESWVIPLSHAVQIIMLSVRHSSFWAVPTRLTHPTLRRWLPPSHYAAGSYVIA